MIPALTSDRLDLRAWQMEDFAAYADFYTDPQSTRYIGGPQNLTDVWQGFCSMAGQWLIRGVGVFAIEERTSQRLAGYAGLWFPVDIQEPELCWGLFKDFHGKGYATEAALAVQRWAHSTLGLPPLMSFTHPDNTASQKVALRLGAHQTETTQLRGGPRLVFRHVIPAT